MGIILRSLHIHFENTKMSVFLRIINRLAELQDLCRTRSTIETNARSRIPKYDEKIVMMRTHVVMDWRFCQRTPLAVLGLLFAIIMCGLEGNRHIALGQ